MNKKVFLICIESNRPTDSQRVESVISMYIAERYAVVMNNVYVVMARDFNATCESIRGQLTSQLYGFQIFIMQTSTNAAWRLEPSVDSKLNSIL